MKVTRLTIKNIGKIADASVDLNKPLLLFYGEIRQGKTTILNAVRWVCGGSFPSDIISHGEKEAAITLEFEGGMIAREWYIGKDKVTKARDLTFIRNGKPVSSPVAEIKRFLNPFLLDQDYLRNMSELDRKKFFAEMFAVDTTDLDKEAFNAERDARELRAKIKGYGDIDLTKVESVDAAGLKSKLAKIRQDAAEKRSALETELRQINEAHEAHLAEVTAKNNKIAEDNRTVDRGEESVGPIETEIADLKKRLKEREAKLAEIHAWLKAHPKTPEIPKLAAPDTTKLKQSILATQNLGTEDLEAQIQNAAAQNVRAEQYEKNLKRAEARTEDEAKLSALEKRTREIKAEKIAKLKGVSDTCGITALAFDEEGNFTYQGTQAGMLSTSQIMRLSSEISALYPEGLGVDLIDRAESLGTSVFEFVDKAKAEQKTILATIVGERPAKVPENIGVFIVKDGQVSPAE